MRFLFYRVDPQHNMHRFYSLSMTIDLFGMPVVCREWGRIGREGRCQRQAFSCADDAAHVLRKLIAAKLRRGYRVQDCGSM